MLNTSWEKNKEVVGKSIPAKSTIWMDASSGGFLADHPPRKEMIMTRHCTSAKPRILRLLALLLAFGMGLCVVGMTTQPVFAADASYAIPRNTAQVWVDVESADAADASLALTLSMAPFHAAYAAGLTAMPSGTAYDVAPRVPVIESAIGRGSVSTPNETTVALPGVEGDKAALVRISVFDVAADLDVTVAGAPALHVANGQDASTTVLAPVRNGAISLGASTAVNARVEVLATFDPDVTAPGATIALDAPVTRADTSKALGLSALGAAAESFGVVGLGGVPSDDVRAVYATLTIDATDTGTIEFGGQDLTVPAGRSVISTIVTPDADGNVAIAADDALAGTTNIRVDVRGYVTGSPQNTELANVAGSYVPAVGTAWSSAKASSSKTGSLSLPDTGDSAFGIALVSAIRTGDSDTRTFVDVGKTIGGRSTGMLVDEAGALPQLEIVEDVDGRTPVVVRGASVNVDAMLLGDIVGDRPEVNDTVDITIDSPEQNATLDFAKTGGITIAGTVDADSAVEAVEIYGDDEKIGTVAVDYTTDGATWTFTGAAPHDGVVTYEAKAVTRDGADASSSLNVNVTLPAEDETVIDPDTVVLPAGADSPVASIDEQTVTFNNKPEFHVGQIIVSDVCEGAPEGFLRWVDAIELNGDQWIVTTHQAALTEAIMQGKTQAGTDTTPDRVSLSEPDTAPEGNITVLDGPEKSLTLLGEDGSAVSGVSTERSVYAAQPAVAHSSDAKARAVAAKAKSDWVDQDDRDVKISASASVSKKYALFGGGDSTSVGTEDKVEVGDGSVSRAVDISETSESNKKKITDQLSVSGGVSFNVKATAELYVLFGLEIDMHWDWNPLNDVSYLKAEGGSSLEGEIGVEGTASLTWSDSVKIGKLEAEQDLHGRHRARLCLRAGRHHAGAVHQGRRQDQLDEERQGGGPGRRTASGRRRHQAQGIRQCPRQRKQGHDVPQCRVLRRTEPDAGNRHRGRPQAEAV